MSNAYTHDLYYGNPVSFEDFVLTCARGMGVGVLQKDEPLAPNIEERVLSPRFAERVAIATARVVELHRLTDEQWRTRRDEEHEDSLIAWEVNQQSMTAVHERYKGMLAQVRAWTPPTADHEGLKTFMITQLEDAICHDTESNTKRPALIALDDYKKLHLDFAQRELTNAELALAKESERVAAQVTWVRELYASLGLAS